ncbi:hypothetical protein AND_008820 [Anopheles darlingi]|uniref:Secreted protein n=1 Tax=Anopheles darlingi TaxID=43151 RepID=W5J9S0_ANODA|nr:hypothetical protein AND_008820 [Anopheles darlingi]
MLLLLLIINYGMSVSRHSDDRNAAMCISCMCTESRIERAVEPRSNPNGPPHTAASFNEEGFVYGVHL